jgi:hypothetical protein
MTLVDFFLRKSYHSHIFLDAVVVFWKFISQFYVTTISSSSALHFLFWYSLVLEDQLTRGDKPACL